jgi:hypothetical protein
MPQSVSHNHHFIPQFLLRNFLDDKGKIWIYDTTAKTIEARGTKGAASVEDLYAWNQTDGTTDFQTVEDYFSRLVENDAAKVIRKLLGRGFLSTEEVHHFFRFVAAQLCRTPAFFSRITESMAPIMQEMCERMAKHDSGFRESLTQRLATDGTTPEQIDELLSVMGSGGMQVKPGREFVMQQGLKMIEEMARHFSTMRWCFFDVPANDPDLVIGDHPVTLHDADPASDGRRPIGILSPQVEILLPLSPRMIACARWEGPVSYGELEAGAVVVANQRALRAAQHYIYASHRSESLLSKAIAEKALAPKVQVRRVSQGEGLAIITEYY